VAKKTELEQQIAELEKLRAKGVVTEDEYSARRAAIMAAAPTMAPAKGGGAGRGIMKWGFFGCVGIFAALGILVIVVIVAIAAAVGGSADSTKDSGGDVHVSLAAGSSGEISAQGNGSKKSKVTIVQVTDNATSTNQLSKPAAGKKYWAMQVTVEDTGSKEVTSLDWKLRDSKDIETGRTFVAGVGDNLEVAYTLTPGGKTTGWVVFEIDADSQPKWVRADPNVFLKNDLYFDAK
jgi:hypothetical protein